MVLPSDTRPDTSQARPAWVFTPRYAFPIMLAGLTAFWLAVAEIVTRL
ncbi:hypothetical protein [uncultured Sphingomonas sp.]|nr:hypothetical protein [uncultured Sphingomonas sp.]